MTQATCLANVALISLPGESSSAPVVVGKILQVRQVEYAAAMGCSKIVLLGGGDPGDAIAIRRATESAGLKLVEVSGPHALASAVGPDDSLLVLQHNVLPAWDDWQDFDKDSGMVLTLPAAGVVDIGFERIDLARAWAGALVIPGKHLSRLEELPEDSEAVSALLRIGLQARLPDCMLDEAMLRDGDWSIIASGTDLHQLEEGWLGRYAKPALNSSYSELAVAHILRKAHDFLLSHEHFPVGGLGASIALAAGAIVAGYYGQGGMAFGMLAVACIFHSLALGTRRLREIPFVRTNHWPKVPFLFDVAFGAAAFLSLDGGYATRIFLPFVVLGAFHAAPKARAGWRARVHDRALTFALAGAGTFFLQPEGGLMLVSAVLLVLNLVLRHRPEG